MTDPEVLLDALVEKMGAIPALAALLGNPANLIAYKDQHPLNADLSRVVDQLKQGQVLVVWNGTAPQDRGYPWRHSFRVLIRNSGNAMRWFVAIANGVPAGGDGLDFRHTVIHESCAAIGALTCVRQSLPKSETVNIDYLEVALTLLEKTL